MNHHQSCKPNDTALVYHCEQCGNFEHPESNADTNTLMLMDCSFHIAEYNKLAEENSRLRERVERIREAINNRGPAPDYHKSVQMRHRKEWPTLWDAIDESLKDDGGGK